MTAAALPATGELLSLRAFGLDERRAVVESASEGALELVLAPAQAPLGPEAAGRAAYVEYGGGEGVCQLPGSLTAPVADGSRVSLHHAGRVELLRRRAFVRAALQAGVVLVPVERPGPACRTSTVDVSGGGMLVRGDDALEVGELLEFTLLLEEAPVSGTCRPVRRTAGGDVGLQFTEIAEAERDQLVHAVFRAQQQSRD